MSHDYMQDSNEDGIHKMNWKWLCPFCNEKFPNSRLFKKHLSKHLVKPSVVVWIIIAMFLFGVYCEYMILTH